MTEIGKLLGKKSFSIDEITRTTGIEASLLSKLYLKSFTPLIPEEFYFIPLATNRWLVEVLEGVCKHLKQEINND